MMKDSRTKMFQAQHREMRKDENNTYLYLDK